MDKLFVFLAAALMLFSVVILFAFLGGIITQWAWAGSVAEIFHLPGLTFWQAFCLNLLGGMVCKGSYSGGSKS